MLRRRSTGKRKPEGATNLTQWKRYSLRSMSGNHETSLQSPEIHEGQMVLDLLLLLLQKLFDMCCNLLEHVLSFDKQRMGG